MCNGISAIEILVCGVQMRREVIIIGWLGFMTYQPL